MNRLQSELARLYRPGSQDNVAEGLPPWTLVDKGSSVRAMVMELARPADWTVLGRVWHGVQDELELPAPAIAVSGSDGLQLWFSVAEPIAATRAHAFLEHLCRRFLPNVEPGRVRLMPAAEASNLRQDLHAGLVPARQPDGSGNWSAFLAPDLVAVFAETPWLDIPPSTEGQAMLLRGIDVMTMAAFGAACARLGLVALRLPVEPSAASLAIGQNMDAGDQANERRANAMAVPGDPRAFLLQVMGDEGVSLALRIKAAKALLQHPSVGPVGLEG